MAASVEKQSNVLEFPWWVVLLEGIASVLIGLFLVTSPGLAVVVLVRVLGWYWLIVGTLSIVSIFTDETDIPWGWLLARGIIAILASFYVLGHPLTSALLIPATLVIVMGVQGIVIGIIGIIVAFMGKGWGIGISGAISLIFGIILLGSPFLAAAVLPFVFGAFALVGGIVAIVQAFRLR